MKNYTKLLCTLVLFINTACGGQSEKAAISGTDQGTFFVNRVDETVLEDGTKEFIGNVGIVSNIKGKSKEQTLALLDQAAEKDEILYLNEDELRINGLTLGEEVVSNEQVAPIFWVGLGFILGAWVGEVSARSTYYNDSPVNYYGHSSCRTCYETCTSCVYRQPAPRRDRYRSYDNNSCGGFDDCIGNQDDYHDSYGRPPVTTTNTYFSYSY